MKRDLARNETEPPIALTATQLRIGLQPRPLRAVGFWLIIGDLLALVGAWSLSLIALRFFHDDTWWAGVIGWWNTLGENRLAIFAGLIALTLGLFGARGHYTRRWPFGDEVLDVLKVFLFVAVVDGIFAYLTKWQFSRAWFMTAWLTALLLVPVLRVLSKKILIRAELWQTPTAIFGAGNNAREAAEALQSEPLMGLDVIAFLASPEHDPEKPTIVVNGKHIPVFVLGQDLRGVIQRLGSPRIVVALEADNLAAQQTLLQRLAAEDSEMSVIPPLRGLPSYGMEVTHFFRHEVLMLTVRNNLARPSHQLAKRVFDVVGAIVLLIFLAPLFAYLSFRIRKSGGPAIFKHSRVGRHGMPFDCLKFRTMVPNADELLWEMLARDIEAQGEWARYYKLKDDPRVTEIGLFLRETSLDELPQLWNVVKGEMSLVGPRPVVKEELSRYGDQLPYYLEARPGITGLWQISGRNNTGYEDRVALDSWYVRNWSLWYDLVILAKTVRVVLAREGAY
jgi:Undecaprenyl-phosphate galactose phosphotransferase WbaP